MVRQASVYKIGHFNKQDIRELCPTLSNSSIENAFRDLIAIGETQKEGKGIRSMSLDVWSTSSHSLSAERKTPSFAAHIKDYRIVDSPSPSLKKVNSNSLFCTTHGFHCLHLGLKSFPSADCMQSQLTGSSHRSSNYWPSNISAARIQLKAIPLKYSTSSILSHSAVEIPYTVRNRRNPCWSQLKQKNQRYQINRSCH